MFKVHSGLSKKFLELGVKRVFIIGLVPYVTELYANVKRIWINYGIDHLKEYTVPTDLKLCNGLLGMMSHSSCYPCAWCNTRKDALNKRGNQRTIVNLMKLFWDFFESRSEKQNGIKFVNVIHRIIVLWNRIAARISV